MQKGEVRDCNIDHLLAKQWIRAHDVVNRTATLTGTNAPFNLACGYSVGSPTLAQIPGTRHAGIQMLGTTITIDHFWRIPSEVDKNWPIYFRHHWATSASGVTPTVAWTQYVATLTSATALTTSPTAVLNRVIPDSSNSASASYSYNLTGRGMIAPIGTGLAAYQVMDDNIEALHIELQPASANFSLVVNNVWWLGMDIEYTPRRTFGTGSQREGRKLQTNLGFQEVDAASDYGV